MALLDPERAKRTNREIRDGVVERIHAALLVTKGTSAAPSRQSLSKALDFILDECFTHPDYKDEVYFWGSGGFVVYVHRDERGSWDNYQVLVPATDMMIEYKSKSESEETES